ncbi:ABC transporter permease [Siculibacillus lacustris]|uniref:ABC transporter permease n=2 Tax=Siculibacillus lacustris TaxID=1549641 RepID=A0A4Q9VM62_9HYPH|nr:ABC transporter permease [Siculibacillus lacustris]
MSTTRLAAIATGALTLLGGLAPLTPKVTWSALPLPALLLAIAVVLGAGVLPRLVDGFAVAVATLVTAATAVALLIAAHAPSVAGEVGVGFVITLIALWLGSWALIERLTVWRPTSPALARLADAAVPIVFGAFLFLFWEVITVGFGVPAVLLPPPSQIAVRFATSLPILGADFFQTVVRAAIPGWAIGSAAGILVALLADRVPFLGRGLIPLGDFVSALPLVGIAPIMVMWFGFDWQSKAAVVVLMTFFPALVNTVAGLAAAGRLERDLMHSYGASWGQTLVKLRLPAAGPHIFAALKLNSTFALIGALVAEFFGTPIVGMGFRISTEVGRMGLDMVWAEIAMAAITGSTLYSVLASIERRVTFWHPSNRGR